MLEPGAPGPRYSIVVPFHNEEESLLSLYEQLCEVMAGRYEPVEFVLVDDHSSDATPRLLAEIAVRDPRVRVIRLRKNYGQTAALAAGFDHADGEIIIAMDGDLQHDPADIPAMLEAMEETGCDLVSGWRKKRVDNFWLRRLPSRTANWMMAKLSGVDIHDFGTTFKVYRREVIKEIHLYGELHRFIPALASWHGATVIEVPIRNIERPQGRSHYGISRTGRVFFDLITIRFLLRYMSRPLHFFGPAGLGGLAAGSGILAWLLFEKVFHGSHLFFEHGPMLVLGIMLVLFGVELLAIGLLGELIVRTHSEAHRQPVYRVEAARGVPAYNGRPGEEEFESPEEDPVRKTRKNR
ncbi:MAG TPA: glycosyltransferase family 2 protein [Candidatus Dormibacteraeota bacterium]|nr:glycosyltransferase family 2 protein [Candidatus Dormibacteraeota bacterium]